MEKPSNIAHGTVFLVFVSGVSSGFKLNNQDSSMYSFAEFKHFSLDLTALVVCLRPVSK